MYGTSFLKVSVFDVKVGVAELQVVGCITNEFNINIIGCLAWDCTCHIVPGDSVADVLVSSTLTDPAQSGVGDPAPPRAPPT